MDGALKIDSIEGLKTMSSKIEPNNSWSLVLTTSVSKESKPLQLCRPEKIQSYFMTNNFLKVITKFTLTEINYKE